MTPINNIPRDLALDKTKKFLTRRTFGTRTQSSRRKKKNFYHGVEEEGKREARRF